jgi:hypothetical protein
LTPSATSAIAPVSSRAPTITKRATKKNNVGHSIFDSASSSEIVVINSPMAAPVRATVAGSM